MVVSEITLRGLQGPLAVSSEKQLQPHPSKKDYSENYTKRPNSSKSVFPAPQNEMKNE